MFSPGIEVFQGSRFFALPCLAKAHSSLPNIYLICWPREHLYVHPLLADIYFVNKYYNLVTSRHAKYRHELTSKDELRYGKNHFMSCDRPIIKLHILA